MDSIITYVIELAGSLESSETMQAVREYNMAFWAEVANLGVLTHNTILIMSLLSFVVLREIVKDTRYAIILSPSIYFGALIANIIARRTLLSTMQQDEVLAVVLVTATGIIVSTFIAMLVVRVVSQYFWRKGWLA